MRIRKSWIITAVIVLLAAYAASGFYFIQPEELGVVRWFGHAPEWSRSVPPGLHYALPWPFCQVDQPTTSEVRRVYVGLLPAQREAIARGEVASLTASPASDMLTGDVNVLKITMVVQYQVIDPAAYLFVAEDPDKLVRDTVQAELINALAVLPVDAALTVAKSELQRVTRERAQAVLEERYGCGVLLTDTTLEAIEPPRAIIAAFQDVVSAKKDGERSVDSAIAESSRVLSRARGEAGRLRAEALGYRQTRISRARGESARFLSVLAEYRRQPAVFQQRLLRDTFETVLPNIRTYVLDNKPGDPTTNLRIIESERGGGGGD